MIRVYPRCLKRKARAMQLGSAGHSEQPLVVVAFFESWTETKVVLRPVEYQ